MEANRTPRQATTREEAIELAKQTDLTQEEARLLGQWMAANPERQYRAPFERNREFYEKALGKIR